MKNRLIKSTILIAITTLVMLNIQILFDTSNSTFFQGSTAKASDEYNGDKDPALNYNNLENHYLKKCWCIIADLQINGIDWSPILEGKWPTLDTEGSINFNGRILKCVEIARDIYCYAPDQGDCMSRDEMRENDIQGDQESY